MHLQTCSSSRFPFCRGESGHSSVCCTTVFLIFPSLPVAGLFPSTFLCLLPFLGLSSDNPPILAVVLLIFCNIVVSLSQIFLVTSRLSFLPCVQSISSGSMQALVPTYSLRSFFLLLSTISLSLLLSCSSSLLSLYLYLSARMFSVSSLLYRARTIPTFAFS